MEDTAVTLARLEERIQHLHKDIDEMNAAVTELRATSNRWKGAFIVILAVGGLIGFIADWTINLIK